MRWSWLSTLFTMHLLQPPPNDTQEKCLRYLEALIRTFGSDQRVLFFSGTGGKINVAQARLGELSSAITRLGSVGDPYAWVPCDDPVGPSTQDEALQPYRSLCAERLVIRGTGSWDPSPCLDNELRLAFKRACVLETFESALARGVP